MNPAVGLKDLRTPSPCRNNHFDLRVTIREVGKHLGCGVQVDLTVEKHAEPCRISLRDGRITLPEGARRLAQLPRS